MEIDIRFGTLADLEAYTQLLQQTYVQAYVNYELGLTSDCFSTEIFSNLDTQKYLQSHLINTSTQKTWLAWIGDKLVGSITCILINDHEAELTGFYVHPDHQGKGIGKELYDRATEFAENRDLILDIYVHNKKSIEIYKNWGWELDTSRGENGYFYRHWDEWPEALQAKCMYMRLNRN